MSDADIGSRIGAAAKSAAAPIARLLAILAVIGCFFMTGVALVLAGAWLQLDAMYGGAAASFIVGGGLLACALIGVLLLAGDARPKKRAPERARRPITADGPALMETFVAAMTIGRSLKR